MVANADIIPDGAMKFPFTVRSWPINDAASGNCLDKPLIFRPNFRDVDRHGCRLADQRHGMRRTARRLSRQHGHSARHGAHLGHVAIAMPVSYTHLTLPTSDLV